jgi:hypothetical protein
MAEKTEAAPLEQPKGSVPMPGSAAQRSLEERLQTENDAWIAEPGEMLVGLVVDLTNRASEYGPYPAVTVRNDDGTELVFHAFRTVAKQELIRARPIVGDRIGILYTGPVEGADYHGYRVRLERVNSEATLDWDRYETIVEAESKANKRGGA